MKILASAKINQIFNTKLKLSLWDWTALTLSFSAAFTCYLILCYKYYHFGYYDWDLALYANSMWSLTQGSPQSSLFGTNFWANHANYIALLLVPIYKIFPHPLTLVTLKILSFASGGFLLYQLAKRPLGGFLANVLLLAYLCFPANIFMMLHEFDFESLSIILIFLTFYFQTKNNFKGFIVGIILLASVKENMPFVIMAWGIYHLVFTKNNKLKWGGVTFFWGMVAAIVIFKVLTPWARTELASDQNTYLGMYSALSPGRILRSITTPTNLKYLTDLFGPLAMYSMLSPHILFLALPLLLQNMLSSVWTMHTIFYHYTSAIIPFIFLATINTFRILKGLMRPLAIQVLVVLLAISCFFHVKYFFPYITQKASLWNDKYNSVRREILTIMPPESAVTATFDFLNELSNRKKLYAFYDIYRGHRVFTGKDVAEIGESADYALIDFSDEWIYNETNANREVIHERIQRFFNAHRWKVVRAFDNIVLLRKDWEGPPLLEISNTPITVPPEQNLSLNIDDGILKLESVHTSPANIQTDKTIPLTFFWSNHAPLTHQYIIRLGILKDGKLLTMAEHSIGYSIFPTFLWKKENFVKENFWFYVPKLTPGEYQISMAILNADQNTLAKLFSPDPAKVRNNIFEIGTIHIE